MAKLTKDQLEAVSVLIKACKLVGATYHEDCVVFADGNTNKLPDYPHTLLETQIYLLKAHLKILEEKA